MPAHQLDIDKSGCSSCEVTGSYCKLYIIQGHKLTMETFNIIMNVTPETNIVKSTILQ